MIDFLVMKFSLVYTTCGSKKDAGILVSALLERKFIACANIVACESMFAWKGTVKHCKECGIFLKTTKQKAPALVKRLKKIHPYQLPCITVVSAGTTQEFCRWIENEVSK